jgi:hypothetical protein
MTSPQYANPEYAAQQHTPPPATYPTAPPWAPEPAPAAALPEAPLQPYGQLLVPYPEEMQNASRVGAPSWWPIILWTLIFGGLIGLIPTVRRANRARRMRGSVAPYWITWAVTFAAGTFASYALVVPVATATVIDTLEHARTDRLQSALAHSSDLKTATGATPSAAQCEPTATRTGGGDRRYTCLIRFTDDSTGTLDVVATPDGQWTAVQPPKK